MADKVCHFGRDSFDGWSSRKDLRSWDQRFDAGWGCTPWECVDYDGWDVEVGKESFDETPCDLREEDLDWNYCSKDHEPWLDSVYDLKMKKKSWDNSDGSLVARLPSGMKGAEPLVAREGRLEGLLQRQIIKNYQLPSMKLNNNTLVRTTSRDLIIIEPKV